MTIAKYLMNLDATKNVILNMNFSSRTTSMDVQRSVEDIVEKRTKDTYGPAMGKRLILFFDDVNMPRVDLYGGVCCSCSLTVSHSMHTRVDSAFGHLWFQRLKLKYDELLSDFACFGFNCKVRPCRTARSSPSRCSRRSSSARACTTAARSSTGGALHVDPGSTQLTLEVHSTLETDI